MSYGYKITSDKDFDLLDKELRASLKDQGFGVITEIDVKATMKEKLGADFRRYRILGACNPPVAHSALLEDLEIGLLLPCNVIIYENDDNSVTVTAIDAEKLLTIAGHGDMAGMASKINGMLKAALDSL